MPLKNNASSGGSVKPPKPTFETFLRNGVCLTLELEARGLFRGEPKPPFLTSLDQKIILRGRTRNSIKEEVILNAVIKDLRNHEADSYERWGLKFSRLRGVWVQNTANIVGDLVADSGMVIMGNLVLENVTFPEGMKDFGNPYDSLHGVPYIKLKGFVCL